MRVFVTGASGVIGSRVVPALVAAGHDVTAVARSPEKEAALASQGAKVAMVDLFAPAALRSELAGHEAVLNLATHIPPSTLAMLKPGAWRENHRIRRLASAHLVDAALAAGVRRFVQESFAPIYESQGERWIDEQSPMRPPRFTRAVLDAEASARRFTDAGGSGVVLRFAAFYGPDSWQLGEMVAAVRRGFLPLLGPAGSYVSSVSHDDAAAAVMAALDVAPGIYNVADDEPLTHRAFADALADALDVPPPRLLPAWTAYLAGSIGRLFARSLRISNRKLRDASNWAPRFRSAREGLRVATPAFPLKPRQRRIAAPADAHASR